MRKTVLALAGLCCASWALAQSASDAANAERMERAKRDASNPLRMIIEASSVKRAKPAEATPAAAPAAGRAPAEGAKAVVERKAPPRSEALSPSAEPVSRPVATKPPVAEPDPAGRAGSPASASAAVTALEPTALAPVPVATGPEGQRTAVPPASAPEDASAALPAVVPAAAVPAAAALASPLASTATSQPHAAADAPLKLVRYVEPEIPTRLRGRLKPSSEVTVAFKVRPDGSVSDVGIRATTARALDPVVLEAVRQWRYDPVPAEREHVVQLVFNLGE